MWNALHSQDFRVIRYLRPIYSMVKKWIGQSRILAQIRLFEATVGMVDKTTYVCVCVWYIVLDLGSRLIFGVKGRYRKQ